MKRIILLFCFFLTGGNLYAQDIISATNVPGAVPIVADGQATGILVTEGDYFLVNKAAEYLQQDIQRITGEKPEIHNQIPDAQSLQIVIGSVDKSGLIKQLVEQNKLDISDIKGKWETYKLQVVDHPFKGIDKALVIVGSDRRGTAYGVFTLSKQMGVSPWHWWADVPVKKKDNVYVKSGTYKYGPPAVKYRGFFINDEAPALSGWVYSTFGEFDHQFYEKVFELILRLKANYLWPAMWGRMFAVDDTLNPKVADKYGIVMGTSHHEPLMRAHAEWQKFGEGSWNYQKNDSRLRAFWREGMERSKGYEKIVTIGMRGDGDKPMSEERNIQLLEQIVHDQRRIIENVTGKDPSKTPQIWALYKEVQQYYDQGMDVPKDVTLLFSDDNWGNIRRLPRLKDSIRGGGYGIYYHFDYVGGPRSYKWINTNPLPKIWQQMHLAYQYNARRIWIVNVGDIKPMEFPTSFWLDYAWNPEEWSAERLPEYTRQWTEDQFGAEFASDIAKILTKYTKYNSRRKPELLSADTYSLINYREAERVVDAYNQLSKKAEDIYEKLPENYKAAYYQLVLYPVKASANLNEMYVMLAKNRWYAEQGRAATNKLAGRVQKLFKKDAELADYYNTKMAGGKWNHMMDQSNIGYMSWDDPKHDIMPEVDSINVPNVAEMGVAVQGSQKWWPEAGTTPVMPTFNKFQYDKHYIEIFNRGQTPFEYSVQSDASWLNISSPKGRIDLQKRLWVTVNWSEAPSGFRKVPITITGPQDKVEILAEIRNPLQPRREEVTGFVETDGYVSIEAAHYTKAVGADNIHWQVIPNLGRTLSGVAPMPVTADTQNVGGNSPHMEYRMYLHDGKNIVVKTYMSPTLDVLNSGGPRFAVSVDDKQPKILSLNINKSYNSWAKAVSRNIVIKKTQLKIDKGGYHRLKFWMVDPGVVLQKIVVDVGGLQSSYLGPPESFHGKIAN